MTLPSDDELLKAAQAFKKNTKRSRDGRTITCRLGLWSVTAPTKEGALREAQRYFALYFLDGEYDEKP
jgi:alkanesulfonate monooxygenase SsuD/methylene tetrahydromethanopterin reductase-like flavin-dependent oxidoreductase (luciferase family)